MSHGQLSELMPWYVNGTLAIGERQASALESASCDACAADLDDLSRIQAALIDLHGVAPEPDPSSFAKALAAADAEEDRRRLGHPWFGWWWSLAPLRRAVVTSVAIAAIVGAAALAIPWHQQPETGVTVATAAIPVELENAPSDASASRAQQRSNRVVAVTDQTSVRSGEMHLSVADVAPALTSIVALERDAGASVTAVDVRDVDGGRVAQIRLVVPRARFDAAVAALGSAGEETARDVAVADVGPQLVRAGAALLTLGRTENDESAIAKRATTVDDMLAAERALDVTRSRIEDERATVRSLRSQVAFASLTIDLVEQAPVAADPTAGQRIASSWSSALLAMESASVAVASAAVWLAAFIPYIAVIGLLGFLIVLRLRR